MVVSFSHSPSVALSSLVFLVVIRNISSMAASSAHIHARAWEVLLAMLAMEAAFGLPGVVAAPIYYAYLKQELMDRGLV